MRITKEARNDIVVKVLAAKFKERETALEASRTALADELYHLMFGSVEAAARALPPGWVDEGDNLVLNAPGWTCNTNQWRHRRGEEPKLIAVYEPHSHLRLSKPRPMPVVHALHERKIEKGHTLYPHSQAIAKEHRAILEDKEILGEKLRALLNSVTTYKQLREAWPEGEKFFPADAKPMYAVVPATLTHEINRLLGLEPSLKRPARNAIAKAARKETTK